MKPVLPETSILRDIGTMPAVWRHEQLQQPPGSPLMYLGGVGRARRRPAASPACPARAGDLTRDPVPVADALEGDGSPFGEVAEQRLDGAWLVVNPLLGGEPSVLVQDGELRMVRPALAGQARVVVASGSMMGHRCTCLACELSRHECSGRCSAFMWFARWSPGRAPGSSTDPASCGESSPTRIPTAGQAADLEAVERTARNARGGPPSCDHRHLEHLWLWLSPRSPFCGSS